MKLDMQHKHILTLINKGADKTGWCEVSSALYPHLSKNMPKELTVFEENSGKYRAKLTDNGKKVLYAMDWL